jgi:hypothetical protein
MADSMAPSITVTVASRCMVTGTGFVPNHDVTIRVAYTADDASDYLTFTTDSTGSLRAVLPTSAAAGTLRIIATDHRPDSTGVCGLVWSNTATIDARTTWRSADLGDANARPWAHHEPRQAGESLTVDDRR